MLVTKGLYIFLELMMLAVDALSLRSRKWLVMVNASPWETVPKLEAVVLMERIGFLVRAIGTRFPFVSLRKYQSLAVQTHLLPFETNSFRLLISFFFRLVG